MANRKVIWVCAAILLFMTAGSANATYIGTYSGNDTVNKNKNYINEFLNDNDDYDIPEGSLELLGKSDEGVAVTLNDDGTWTLNTDDFSSGDVGFISVKAGKKTYVFRADDFNYLFDEDGNQIFHKDVSHISFWKADGYGGPGHGPGPGPGPGAQVPEPATIFLLGSGLLGFLGYRKKFWKSKSDKTE